MKRSIYSNFLVYVHINDLFDAALECQIVVQNIGSRLRENGIIKIKIMCNYLIDVLPLTDFKWPFI